MGSPDTPLHANAFAGFATRENIFAVAEFFETQLPFFRLGAIILFKTAAADGLGLVSTLAKVLQERIRGIASRTAFNSLAVIFESSQRADRLVGEAFEGFGLQEGETPLPVECYFIGQSPRGGPPSCAKPLSPDFICFAYLFREVPGSDFPPAPAIGRAKPMVKCARPSQRR